MVLRLSEYYTHRERRGEERRSPLSLSLSTHTHRYKYTHTTRIYRKTQLWVEGGYNPTSLELPGPTSLGVGVGVGVAAEAVAEICTRLIGFV